MAALFVALLILAMGQVIIGPRAAAESFDGSVPSLASFHKQAFGGTLDVVGIAIGDDGAVFLAEKAGRIQLLNNGVFQQVMAPGDFRSTIDAHDERGLLGIAADPAYSSNHYLYVYYTCAVVGSTAAHNRVSRLTVAANAGAVHVVPGSELTLLDLDNLTTVAKHNGGGLTCDGHGNLFICVGNNQVNANSTSTTSLLGKVLRIRTDAPNSFPADNPFIGDPVAKHRAVYAYGLRNPFSGAFQKETGRFFANDVGESHWEEIDDILPGKNYGWSGGSTDGLHSPADGTQPPLFTYARNSSPDSFPTSNNWAITGGDFCPQDSAWPAALRGRYFFSDYSQLSVGWIRSLDVAQAHAPKDISAVKYFINGLTHPLVIRFAPNGDMYFLTRGADGAQRNDSSTNGQLWRVWFAQGGTTQVPTRLVITAGPATVGAGATLPAITVAIHDATGALVPTATSPITLALGADPGGATLAGQLTVAASGGVATFSGLSIARPGVGYSIVATSGTLTAATSAAFDVLDQASRPSIAPGSTTWSGPIRVRLASATPGAVIHYTTDGSVPTVASPVYVASAPLVVSAPGAKISALATAGGLITSAVAITTYTVTGSEPYGLPVRQPFTARFNVDAPPATLQATGLFSVLDPQALQPIAGFIPYTVNTPLWSDGAVKQRWVAVPSGATIGFTATDDWAFPDGTILIKHFMLPTNDADASVLTPIETRIMVISVDGSGTRSAAGFTYRWTSSTTATLVTGLDGDDLSVPIATASGGTRTQAWHIPSRNDCLTCHTAAAGMVLGPKSRQLNGPFTYAGNVTDNQVRTWNYLGLFTADIGDASVASMGARYPRMRHVATATGDTPAILQDRVKSYLDANCSQCHRVGGVNVPWDALYGTPMASQGLLGVVPSAPVAGMNPASKLVAPGDLGLSWLYQRVHATTSPWAMPPIGRTLRDTDADATIAAWITSLGSPLELVTISPANHTLAAGTTLQMSAVAKRQDRTAVTPAPPFTWTLQGTGATLSASGLLTAVAGSGSVKVFAQTTVGGITKSAAVYEYLSPGTAPTFSAIAVNPATRAVPVGTSATFTAVAMDAAGSALSPQPAFTWTSAGGGTASGNAPGTYAATTVGGPYTVTVSATVAGVARTATAQVTVTAAPTAFASLVVTPATRTMTAGQAATFSAVALDAAGAALSPQPTITWTASGGGTVDSAGAYSAATVGGPYVVTASATASGTTHSASAQVTVGSSGAIQINFQPAGAAVAGWLVDSGKPFGARGNGYTYGWTAAGSATPLDLSSLTRERHAATSPDRLHDTLVHMQKPGMAATWAIAVPNGTYQVVLVAGDPDAVDSHYLIDAAGVRAIDGVPSAGGAHWFETPGITGIQVIVSDGQLRVTNAAGAVNNKLCFIEIVPVVGGGG